MDVPLSNDPVELVNAEPDTFERHLEYEINNLFRFEFVHENNAYWNIGYADIINKYMPK
jgi:hypothetical protein